MKIIATVLVALGLVGLSGASATAAVPRPDVRIVYEYTDAAVPLVPGTFAVVNYTVNNYWLCLTYTAGGTFWHSAPFHLDGYFPGPTGKPPGYAPGHPLTGLIAVDPGTTITLYAGTATGCTKQKIDTLRVPS